MNPTTSQQPYAISQMPVLHAMQYPQIPVAQAMQSPLAGRMEKYKTTMVNLGITEIVLGGIIFVLDIVILIIAYDIGQGIWCGSVLIACGIVGVMTRSRPSYCMFNANMALSIVAAVFMALLVILSCLYAAVYWWSSAAIALQSVIAVLSFTAFVITIVHSAYSCAGVCNPNSPTQVLMPVQMSNGQVILNPNQMGQPAVYSSYVNPAMVMPIAPNPPPVFANGVVPVAQSTESAPAQGPGYANSPPSSSYSPTK